MIEKIFELLVTDVGKLFLIFFQVILFSFILLLISLEKHRENKKEINYLFYAIIISTISRIILFYIESRNFLLSTSFDRFDTIVLLNNCIDTFALILLVKSFLIPTFRDKNLLPKIHINIKLNMVLLSISFFSIYFLQSYFFHSNILINNIFSFTIFALWKITILMMGIILISKPKFKFKYIIINAMGFLIISNLINLYNHLFINNPIPGLNVIDLLFSSISYPLFGLIIYLGVNEKITKNMQVLQSVNKELRDMDLKKDIYASRLKDEKKKIEAIIDSMSEGVIVTDYEDNILLFNPAAQKVFDNKNNVLGTNLSNFIKRHNLNKVFEEAYKTGQPITKEINLPLSEKILKANVSVLKNQSEKAIGFVTVLEDITKLKELDEMKSEFISIVSHELRTPLTSIKGYASLLSNGKLGQLEDKQKQCLDIINTESDRLTNLINDVLDLSKMESGKMQLKREMVHIKEIYDKLIIHNLAKDKNIKIKPNFQKRLPKIYAEPEKILQVFTNLISNAIKFTPENGTIFVNVERVHDYVVVDIIDTGIGMPKKDLNNIFNKFYQVEKHMTRKQGGTGLGLAIVKEIINLHSGLLTANSKEDEGSKFSFAIPIVQYLKIPPIKCWETKHCKNSKCIQNGAIDLKCWLKFKTSCDSTTDIKKKIEVCKDCQIYTRNLPRQKRTKKLIKK